MRQRRHSHSYSHEVPEVHPWDCQRQHARRQQCGTDRRPHHHGRSRRSGVAGRRRGNGDPPARDQACGKRPIFSRPGHMPGAREEINQTCSAFRCTSNHSLGKWHGRVLVCRSHAPDAIHLDARAPRLCRDRRGRLRVTLNLADTISIEYLNRV